MVLWYLLGDILLSVDTNNNAVTNGQNVVRHSVFQILPHFEAGTSLVVNFRLAHNLIMNTDRHLEIKFNMNQNVFKSQPINCMIENVFKKL